MGAQGKDGDGGLQRCSGLGEIGVWGSRTTSVLDSVAVVGMITQHFIKLGSSHGARGFFLEHGC